MSNNALEQLKRETKDDERLYGCIRELYEQGVPFAELKALIPDIRRTREQLYLKRMLENTTRCFFPCSARKLSFLLDAKERRQEEELQKNLDQLIRQQQSYRKADRRVWSHFQAEKLIPACLDLQTLYILQARPDERSHRTVSCFAMIISACFLYSESLL